jgi:hypothetical protein
MTEEFAEVFDSDPSTPRITRRVLTLTLGTVVVAFGFGGDFTTAFGVLVVTLGGEGLGGTFGLGGIASALAFGNTAFGAGLSTDVTPLSVGVTDNSAFSDSSAFEGDGETIEGFDFFSTRASGGVDTGGMTFSAASFDLGSVREDLSEGD